MALNINQALTSLNARYAEITALILDTFYFYDDSDRESNQIDDGGYDMYDGANAFYTNITGGGGEGGEGGDKIPYTHTQATDTEYIDDVIVPYTTPPMDGEIVDGTDFFGSGSSYFTNMYPGAFVLLASNVSINQFTINGNIGTDGNGEVGNYLFNSVVGGLTYTVYCKFVGETSDPSINHFIIIPNTEDTVSHTFDEESDSDEDTITNEEGTFSEIAYLLVARHVSEEGGEGDNGNGPRISEEDAQLVAAKFIEIIYGTGSGPMEETETLSMVPSPVYSFLVNNIDFQAIFSVPLPDGNVENIINQLKDAAVFIENVPRKLKFGDTFTLSGIIAQKVYNLYIGKLPKVLEVFELPNVENLGVEYVDDGLVRITWNSNNIYLTELEVSIDDGLPTKAVFGIGVKSVSWGIGVGEVQVRARFANYEGAFSPDYTTITITPCAEGETWCGENCADLLTDEDNCGECGNTCADGEVCIEGECVAALPVVTTDDLEMINPLSATIEGTVTSEGLSSLTAYGFVWATHDNPTLEDNVITVGSESFTGNYSNTTGSVLSFGTVYFAAYATNSYGTSYGTVLSGETLICLMEGTTIALSDGEKAIENVKYTDNLLSWNFDDAVLTDAKPVWMVKPFKAPRYGLVKFSDGSVLGTVADRKGHRIFNIEKGQFTYMLSDDTPIGTTTMTDNGDIISVISKEVIEKETTFYNIITNKHINVYANNILTSTGLNNIYPIIEMKFVKDNRVLRTKEEFSNISTELFEGFRLAEQPKSYPLLKEKIMMLQEQKL